MRAGDVGGDGGGVGGPGGFMEQDPTPVMQQQVPLQLAPQEMPQPEAGHLAGDSQVQAGHA